MERKILILENSSLVGFDPHNMGEALRLKEKLLTFIKKVIGFTDYDNFDTLVFDNPDMFIVADDLTNRRISDYLTNFGGITDIMAMPTAISDNDHIYGDIATLIDTDQFPDLKTIWLAPEYSNPFLSGLGNLDDIVEKYTKHNSVPSLLTSKGIKFNVASIN